MEKFSKDQEEATSLLESIEGHLNLEFVNIAVLGNALLEISKDAHDYANNLEGYAVDHAERIQNYENDVKFGRIIK